MMYKNIIFDLGNVLLDFQPVAYLKERLPEDVIEEVYDIIFKSDEWLMLDRGTLTEEEVVHIFSTRHPQYKEYIEKAFDDWYDILQPIACNVALLEKLKAAGYKLYYLSNFHDVAFQEMNKRYAFFKCFTGGVVSYEVKLLKPEPEIYRLLLEKYDLHKEECLFIDDTKKNIEAAIEEGIEGIWLPKCELLEEILRHHLK